MATADDLSDAFDLVRQEVVQVVCRERGHGSRLDDLEGSRGTHNQRLDEQRDRLCALEERIEALMRANSDLQVRLGSAQHRINGQENRLDDLKARVDAKDPPHDFGGVTSTGDDKPMKRWVITRRGREVFSRDYGFIRRGVGVGAEGCVQPWYAASLDDARRVVDLLELFAVGIEEVDVVEREDGRLVEARYA